MCKKQELNLNSIITKARQLTWSPNDEIQINLSQNGSGALSIGTPDGTFYYTVNFDSIDNVDEHLNSVVITHGQSAKAHRDIVDFLLRDEELTYFEIYNMWKHQSFNFNNVLNELLRVGIIQNRRRDIRDNDRYVLT